VARPKSEDRRASLLAAARTVFAEHGLAAPTSLIASTAGVSDGSLFTYFKTKDELLNVLYRELRLELSDFVLAAYPRKAGVRERFEHVFRSYVTWGVENPPSRKVMRQLYLSKAITPELRAEISPVVAEVARLKADAAEQKKLADIPADLAAQTLKALAEMTMDLVEQHPEAPDTYLALGFQMLWGAFAKKA